MPALEERIKGEAQRLGFHLAGITTPGPPASFPRYQRWVEAGYHAEMAYLAKERALARRADPAAILPEVRSILVLGIHYDPPPAAPPPPLTGRIAAYAWGEDYHEALKPRLQALAAFIEAETGKTVPNQWYTDTGPILERDLAQRAGLGWVGKNSMLIHPRRGSTFLLAEIFLAFPLQPDALTVTDHCGTCTRCIDACPTACILPDRTLEAGRCLSYLTIENKGPIPTELRPQLGSWVFGCDICQHVCPWNQRFAPVSGDPAFAPRPGLPDIDLLIELSLTPQEFNRKFKGSPVMRAKRRGYLRNVAAVLGNTDDPRALPPLTSALQNELEALVRGHAAWAIGCIGGEEARAALSQAAATETDPQVLAEIEEALASL